MTMQEMEEGGVGDTLKAIVKRTLPCPKYARYHERHLQRFLSRLGAYPPRYSPRMFAMMMTAGLSCLLAPF